MLYRSYKTNIRLMPAIDFLGFLGITTFWLLYLSQNGMSLLQVGILESIFHGTSVLFELPSGMLADRFSYKLNLYFSRIFNLTFCILMLLGHGNFWLYALAMAVNALSYNFDSGTSSALLYESAVEAGLKDCYLKLSAFMSGVSEASISIGAIIASFFVHGHLEFTYQIMIVINCLVLFFIFLLKEPNIKPEHEEEEVLTLKKIIDTVKLEIKTNPYLLIWITVIQFISVIICMFYFYYQNELPSLSVWQISGMMAVSSIFNILASYVASKLGEKWSSFKLFPWITGIIGLGYLMLILQNNWANISIYLLSDALLVLCSVIFNNELQEKIPSQIRATMLSIESMLFSFSMIIIFPIVGMMIDNLGFEMIFILLGGLLLVTFPILGFVLKHIENKL